MEVFSDNPKVVSHWFQGKLGFSVSVPDLSEKGMILRGARLCHLKDREVAFLIYDYQGHQVSAFMMDMDGVKLPNAQKMDAGTHDHYVKDVKGYQSILCLSKKGTGVGCVWVSDLSREKLLELIV